MRMSFSIPSIIIVIFLVLSKMADAAAARREARRRRILENSHNRLQLISGKNGEECLKEPSVPITSLIPDQNFDIPIVPESTSHTSNCLFNGGFASLAQPFESLSTEDFVAAGDGEVASLLSATSALADTPLAPQPIPTSTLWEKLTANKYDVVLLSLLIQLINTVAVISYENSYFFLPVLVYAVTKFIWFPTQSNSNIANALLLLNNMSTGRVQDMIYVTRCVGAIASDICIYLFVTICTQSLWVVVKDSLIT